MEHSSHGWENYSEEAVKAVLEECGVEIQSETETHFLTLCAFHNNTDSSSMAVQKGDQGLFYCFNPACEEKGTLLMLVKKAKEYNDLQAARLIKKCSKENALDLTNIITKKTADPAPVFVKTDVDINRLHSQLWDSPGHEYMKSRGFEDDTLKHFKIGYSDVQNMVVVPMYAPDGMEIGFVARSVVEKRFKNSIGLPRKETLWNFNNARRYDQVIIVESTFDAMRVHQAGYENVVATLGPSSPKHIEQINRTFSSIVIMTDNDPKKYENKCAKCRKRNIHMCVGHSAGLDLGRKIADEVKGKKVLWGNYGQTRFPPGCKDICDMSDSLIREVFNGKATEFELKMKYNTDL